MRKQKMTPTRALRNLSFLLACTMGIAACGLGSTVGDNTGKDDGDEPVVTDPNGKTDPTPVPADPNGDPNVVTDPDGVVVLPPVLTAKPLRYIGRAADTNTFSWGGVAAEIAFNGTGGNFFFNVLNNANVAVRIDVDGMLAGRQAVNSNIPVHFDAGTAGPHVVRVTKTNEARVGEAKFVRYETDGTPGTVSAPSRRLVFIGDSITTGYGVSGSGNSCVNDANTQDATLSYAALAATALQADYSLIAVAGRGVTRNDTTSTSSALMPAVWQRSIASDANLNYMFPSASAPQAAVFLLGTNDYEFVASNPNRQELDDTAFQAGLQAFVQDVRSRYSGIKILLCSSPMLSDTLPANATMPQHTSLKQNLDAVAAAVDPSGEIVQVLDFPTLAAGATGCQGHPSPAQHTSMANLLKPKLQALLGW